MNNTKQFTVEWSENKTTSTNKPVKNCSLKDVETGTVIDRVTIWGDFPNFANIITGSTVHGEIATNDKGYKSLKMPRTAATGSFKRPGGNMAALVEKKQEGIEKSQDRKEEGIKTTTSLQLAVQLAVAQGDPSMENVRNQRRALLREWELPKGVDSDLPPDLD